jgi:hypothetical protein
VVIVLVDDTPVRGVSLELVFKKTILWTEEGASEGRRSNKQRIINQIPRIHPFRAKKMIFLFYWDVDQQLLITII